MICITFVMKKPLGLEILDGSNYFLLHRHLEEAD